MPISTAGGLTGQRCFIAKMREPELLSRFNQKLRAPEEVLREIQAVERGVANQSQPKSLKAGKDLSPQREKTDTNNKKKNRAPSNYLETTKQEVVEKHNQQGRKPASDAEKLHPSKHTN